MIGAWAKENGLDKIARLYDPDWRSKRKPFKRDPSYKNKGKHR
jgi:hypothetical protein